MAKTSWRELITEALVKNNESWKDMEYITLSERELDETFSEIYHPEYGPEGRPFTAWTKKRVYFPVIKNCGELKFYGVASVSRDPDGKPTEHIGKET
jgi:fibronectin type 3 domain-containing protein